MSEDVKALINVDISTADIKKRYFPNTLESSATSSNVRLVKTIREYFKAKDIHQREKIYLNEVFTNKSYLGILFSTYLNLDHGNISGASLYLKKLTNISPRFLVLDLEELVTVAKRSEFKELILKILVKIWDSRLNEHLKNLYFESLVEIGDVEISELQTGFLGDFLKTKSSFSLEDYRYSVSFSNFWLTRIAEENKKIDLIHKFFNSPALFDIEISEYRVFSLATPGNKIRRDFIFQKLKGAWNSLEYYEKEAVLSAMDNPVFRRELIKIDSIFEPPLFNFKKDEFKKDVNKGSYRVYSVLKLLELGHEDDSMLGYLL